MASPKVLIRRIVSAVTALQWSVAVAEDAEGQVCGMIMGRRGYVESVVKVLPEDLYPKETSPPEGVAS